MQKTMTWPTSGESNEHAKPTLAELDGVDHEHHVSLQSSCCIGLRTMRTLWRLLARLPVIDKRRVKRLRKLALVGDLPFDADTVADKLMRLEKLLGP